MAYGDATGSTDSLDRVLGGYEHPKCAQERFKGVRDPIIPKQFSDSTLRWVAAPVCWKEKKWDEGFAGTGPRSVGVRHRARRCAAPISLEGNPTLRRTQTYSGMVFPNVRSVCTP